MDVYQRSIRNRFVRSPNGIFGGVCEGLGRSFKVEPNFIRLGFVLATLFLGLSLIVYPILYLLMPREDQLTEYYRPKFLGVCYTLSERTNFELPVIRITTVILAVSSLGLILLAYFSVFIYFEFIETKRWS